MSPEPIATLLTSAARRLERASDSPRADAELLLAHVLGLRRAQLYARLDQAPSAEERAEFEALVARRATQVPVAYLTGEKGFWTLTLKVTPDVLVPRPETELLVEWALELLRERRAPRIVDLATGSGAIALALASERPDAQVLATDESPEALAVAQDNARTLALANVDFSQGDWYAPLAGRRFDLIVSNPPYVARGDPHLDALRHEPLLALTDGADGLRHLTQIIQGAPAHLEPGGWLLLEHGHDQGEAVRSRLVAAGLAAVQTRRDLAGHERASGARQP